MPRSSSPAPPARSRAGFTVVELLIALVIGGIIATAVYQVLRSQTQFARFQGAREEVQQNSRAATELIGGELRGVAVQGILAAEAASLTIQVPRLWGQVCAADPTRVVAVFPQFEAGPFGGAGQQVDGRDERLAVEVMNLVAYAFLDARDRTVSRANDARAACNALRAPGAQLGVTPTETARARWFDVDALPAVPAPGDLVYVYDTVEYGVGETTVPGRWILRDGEPLAGPVAEASEDGEPGLRFRYFTADETELTAFPLGPSDRDAVRRIRVEVVTRSGADIGGAPQTDRKAVDIFLRNR